MVTNAAKIITYPKQQRKDTGAASTAPSATPAAKQKRTEPPDAQDFLSHLAAAGIDHQRLKQEQRRILNEINLLRAENGWQDIISLFHPLSQQAPELEPTELATPIRGELAFALSRLGRFDEAISLYQQCIEEDPEHFRYHSGLAYTAYDSLYAAKGRRIMLHPNERRSRIELAHRHFAVAQTLRPDRVTNYYRQGMLYKQIQGKKEQALPLFKTAIENWNRYNPEQRKLRHQERKNFIKALYHLASCLLDGGRSKHALEMLQQCIREDEESNLISIIHKYFALGKVYLSLGDVDQARQAVEVAAVRAHPAENDYVFELLARAYLMGGALDKARDTIGRIPGKRRRPYVLWTEAEIMLAHGDTDQARRLLADAAQKDRLARHKALIRAARLEFDCGCHEAALKKAEQAEMFFRERFQNSCYDALFWKAAALLRLGRMKEARKAANELKEQRPYYPHVNKLLEIIERESTGAKGIEC